MQSCQTCFLSLQFAGYRLQFLCCVSSDVVKNLLHQWVVGIKNEIIRVRQLKGQEARLAALHQSQDSKKTEELTQEEKDDMQNTQKTVSELQDKKKAIVAAYAKGNDIVHQLIDLALLQNGMLQGAALDKFLKRSISLIK